MKQDLVTISFLAYNAKRYVDACLDSVLKQSYPEIELLIIDNASTDDTVSYIEQKIKVNENFQKKLASLAFIKNKRNVGFGAGHNAGVRKSSGEFILFLNQDVVLDEDFIKNAIPTFKKDPKIGAVQGKIFQLKKFKEPQIGQKNAIDTTGLVILRNRRVVNRGEEEIDQGQYEKEEEVFGADGAAPIYRREALEDIKVPIGRNCYEYFDQDFFLYKEDIDLAWRLRLYGWKTVYAPMSCAWHERSGGGSSAINFMALRKRLKLSQKIKFYSWKNQRFMQIKNELKELFLRDFFRILLKEIKLTLLILVFEPQTVMSWFSFAKGLPKMLKKREIIMLQKRTSVKELEKWFK